MTSLMKIQRREFLKASAAATASFVLPRFAIAQPGPSAGSKANIALIGCGDIAGMAINPLKGTDNIVALCDVDSSAIARVKAKNPDLQNAREFADYRVMLDTMGKEIDGVCISTPDHIHFPATLASMQAGKHVCTQKPLTHNVWEARTLRQAAQKYPKLATNMANQGHTYNGIRQMREFYEAGILGKVKEAHSWSGGPNWNGKYFKKPAAFPVPAEPVPESLNWDLWLGPAAETHYNSHYHPLTWRGFWNYGGGTLGDWFCHICDGPVWVLDLYEPTVIECVERAEPSDVIVPDFGIIRWDFPARGAQEPCSLWWYDGGKRPPTPAGWTWNQPSADDPADEEPQGTGENKKKKGKNKNSGNPGPGTFFLGDKGDWYLDERSNNPRHVNRDKMKELKAAGYPAEKYPRVAAKGPFEEWSLAIKGGPACGSQFEYSARLTEVSLLGLIALRHGGRIEWDPAKGEITNRPELNAYIREPVRKGWEYSLA
jgi:predicted dehydrogenase